MTVYTGLQFFGGSELDVYEWDTLYLAGEMWPGICEVTGQGVQRRVDSKSTPGSDGAVLTDNGMDLAKITITLLIYNQIDWIELQRLIPTVHPRNKGGSRNPIEIRTPYTDLLGITQIYITAISPPAIDKAKQWITLTMQAIEWVPTPKPVKQGTGGSGNASWIESMKKFATDAEEAWDNSAAKSALEGIGETASDAVDSVLSNLGLGGE